MESSVEQISFLRTLLEITTLDITALSKVTNVEEETKYTNKIGQKQLVSVFHKWHSAAFRWDRPQNNKNKPNQSWSFRPTL